VSVDHSFSVHPRRPLTRRHLSVNLLKSVGKVVRTSIRQEREERRERERPSYPYLLRPIFPRRRHIARVDVIVTIYVALCSLEDV